ncbi:MAG: hypothetical protein U0930_09825 [Pirellulales bacterium]
MVMESSLFANVKLLSKMVFKLVVVENHLHRLHLLVARVQATAHQRLLLQFLMPILEAARKNIAKYDQDKDGMLSKSEIEKMIVKPTNADVDKDGKVSDEEYAAWKNKK